MSRDDADGQTMGFRNSDEVRNFQDKSMTTPSHTELAAHMALVEEFMRSTHSSCTAIADMDRLEAATRKAVEASFLAALESPERVHGEAVRTQLEWFALAAHWYINASDRELADQGQARGDALKQVHLLSGHLEASGFKFATPSPQAEKQPRGEPDIPIISAYTITDGICGIKVERVQQIDGPAKWAVRKAGSVLSRSGEWDLEPMPSSRTDEWIAEFRFDSADEAIAAAQAIVTKEST